MYHVKYEKETITCPKCGESHEVLVWKSLNAELNPKEKQQLLDGTFFKFTCNCGYTADIIAPLSIEHVL